jgi:hypothetical protein
MSNLPKEFQDALDKKIQECMMFIHEKFQEMEMKLKKELGIRKPFWKWWK